jgi:Sulfotransferase family
MSYQLASEISSELSPIFVTAPSIRSGTTLLQRLLCSSSNALIYGEECGKDLELLLQLYASKVAVYSHSRRRVAASLKRVLDGDVNDWITDLMPDLDGYLQALGRSFLSGLAYCRDYAAEVGRPVWGIKYPGWPPHFINLLRKVMPQSRFIIIHRDITDCLRSAKARRSVNTEQEVRQFCKAWADNLTFMLGMKNDRSVLVISYEELLTEPERIGSLLAGFAGVRDMKLEILNHKINAWADDMGQGASRAGYIEPVTLTETERSIADESASRLRAAVLQIENTNVR